MFGLRCVYGCVHFNFINNMRTLLSWNHQWKVFNRSSFWNCCGWFFVCIDCSFNPLPYALGQLKSSTKNAERFDIRTMRARWSTFALWHKYGFSQCVHASMWTSLLSFSSKFQTIHMHTVGHTMKCSPSFRMNPLDFAIHRTFPNGTLTPQSVFVWQLFSVCRNSSMINKYDLCGRVHCSICFICTMMNVLSLSDTADTKVIVNFIHPLVDTMCQWKTGDNWLRESEREIICSSLCWRNKNWHISKQICQLVKYDV